MSDKLLQKEVRLREEALKKFIDIEKLLQREESARVEFEKQLREETESRCDVWKPVCKTSLHRIPFKKRFSVEDGIVA